MSIGFVSHLVRLWLALALLHFLWQGSLVGIFVLLLLHLFNFRRGTTRYAVYLFAFLIMTACPVVTFITLAVGTPQPVELEKVVASAEGPICSNNMLPNKVPERIYTGYVRASSTGRELARPRKGGTDYLHTAIPWIVIIWLIGVCVLSIRLLLGFAGLYRWRRCLVQLPENLAQSIASLSERLGMPGFLRVFASPFARLPIAVGCFKPMVLLPLTMLTQLPPEMLEAIIAHELAHIRRLDLWVNVFQRTVETFLFYHPIVWWLSNRLRNEREFCCDELAAEATGSRSTYASALEYAGRASLAATKPVQMVGFGQHKKAILTRARHVLGKSTPYEQSRYWFAGILTLVTVVTLGIVSHITVLKLYAGQDIAYTCSSNVEFGMVEESTGIGVSSSATKVLQWVDDETGRTLFTGEDIIRFDWEQQIFELSRRRAMDLLANQNKLSREFTLSDHMGVVYRGTFVNSLASMTFHGPVIVVDNIVKNIQPPLFRIDGGYPQGPERDEIRFAERMKMALADAGVLSEIDLTKPPAPFKRIMSEWAGAKEGPRVLVELFPETFQIGEMARIHLHFAGGKYLGKGVDTLEIKLTLRASNGKFERSLQRVYPIRQEAAWKKVHVWEMMPWGEPTPDSPNNGAVPGPAEISIQVLTLENWAPIDLIEIDPIKVTILPEKAATQPNEKPGKPLRISFTDNQLPCGIGRIKEGSTWNEPYRYVFHSFPDYLDGCQHILMKQNGGGAEGRWFKTGQIAASRTCWLYAAIHRSSNKQHQIWQQEGWEILPEIVQDLGDFRSDPRPIRNYVLMRKCIAPGTINFDTRAKKTNMVIWIFKEIAAAQPGTTVESPPVVIYSNNFEKTVGRKWALPITDTTPQGGRRFLGQFGNETVKLTLEDLPTHKHATVSFDLFLIRSWDGNGRSGPDVWELQVDGGPKLLRTTFSNCEDNPGNNKQGYPGGYPGGDHAARTGAAETNTLGYGRDSVYRLNFSFVHTASTLALDFSARGTQPIPDESWGLDNVEITVHCPSPPKQRILSASLQEFAAN
jgi:beta-lactamase regulating signal transducer with metallopeptidase domain